MSIEFELNRLKFLITVPLEVQALATVSEAYAAPEGGRGRQAMENFESA